jgi:hypothetical protein
LGFIYQKHIDSPTYPHLGKVGRIYGNIMVEFHTVVDFCCCFPFVILHHYGGASEGEDIGEDLGDTFRDDLEDAFRDSFEDHFGDHFGFNFKDNVWEDFL